MDKKEYKKPEITYELKLEAKAGSCRDDSLSKHCDDSPLGLLDPKNLLNLER